MQPASFSGDSGTPPGMQIQGADHQTENIGRDKAELRGPKTDDADDDAVDRAERPPLPTTAPDKDCRGNRQSAGKIIKPQHVRRTSTDILTEDFALPMICGPWLRDRGHLTGTKSCARRHFPLSRAQIV